MIDKGRVRSRTLQRKSSDTISKENETIGSEKMQQQENQNSLTLLMEVK